MRKFSLAPNHTPLKQRGSININDQIGSAWRMTLKYDLKLKIEISNDFQSKYMDHSTFFKNTYHLHLTYSVYHRIAICQGHCILPAVKQQMMKATIRYASSIFKSPCSLFQIPVVSYFFCQLEKLISLVSRNKTKIPIPKYIQITVYNNLVTSTSQQ